MADLFLIIDAEGVCIGIGTRAEIAQLIADGVVPADVTLTPALPLDERANATVAS